MPEQKTAPFDLEKAKDNHPLITRNGEKIVQFIHLKEPHDQTSSDVLMACTENGIYYTYYIDGNYNSSDESNHDLLLDLSTPWIKPLKIGDKVEVEDKLGVWKKRIFLWENEDGSCWCVIEDDEKEYLEGKNSVIVMPWKKDKWRRIPTKPQFDLKVLKDGKEVLLSTLTEDERNQVKNQLK